MNLRRSIKQVAIVVVGRCAYWRQVYKVRVCSVLYITYLWRFGKSIDCDDYKQRTHFVHLIRPKEKTLFSQEKKTIKEKSGHTPEVFRTKPFVCSATGLAKCILIRTSTIGYNWARQLAPLQRVKKPQPLWRSLPHIRSMSQCVQFAW